MINALMLLRHIAKITNIMCGIMFRLQALDGHKWNQIQELEHRDHRIGIEDTKSTGKFDQQHHSCFPCIFENQLFSVVTFCNPAKNYVVWHLALIVNLIVRNRLPTTQG